MNTLMKFVRDAWTNAAGIYVTTPIGAEKKEIRTNIIKRALKRSLLLQQLSFLHTPKIARCRSMDKWLRVHTTRTEELWND
jgi:hypothetical protein